MKSIRHWSKQDWVATAAALLWFSSITAIAIIYG
jgi:hypothetical protein